MNPKVIINNLLILLSLLFLPLNISNLTKVSPYSFVVFVNIGQGDATLICTEQRKCGLIDTGKQTDIIDKIRRYTNYPLEFLILTHSDLDHIDESILILKEIGSKRVFFNYTNKSESKIKEILSITNEVYLLDDLNDFRFNDYVFDVIWPNKLTNLNLYASNETSISILIKFKSYKIFMAGDLGKDLEEFLQQKERIKNISIAKISHHGSKNSTSNNFINNIKPKISVISTGKNSYGHPSLSVLDLLEKEEIQYLRTDKEGDIKIGFNHDKLEITTEISKKSYIILN